MSLDVALATHRGIAADAHDDLPLLAALRRRNIAADLVAWDDPLAAWEDVSLVVVRSTWDYTARRDAFVTWAQEVAAVTALWNPPEVLAWNTHKSYLVDLEERGAPVVPTAWCLRGEPVDLAALLARRGWQRAVVKPAVGASSDGLVVVEPHTVELGQHHLDALLAHGDAMVQPLLTEVETNGEVSIVLIEGAFSHAVRKVPMRGTVSASPERGARIERTDVAPEMVALASWAAELTGHQLLFARVDLLSDAGSLHLVELELTEPSLFLAHAVEAADRLAAAIERRVRVSSA